MSKLQEFNHYLNYLCEALGHADRHAGFMDYSRGLMLPLARKSVEPLPADINLAQLVGVAKMRWRIERDYRELKQEFGLGHYEGRGWRGFHHHATLCIAVYGFLVAWRLQHGERSRPPFRAKAAALPPGYRPRGGRPPAAARGRFHPDAALSVGAAD